MQQSNTAPAISRETTSIRTLQNSLNNFVERKRKKKDTQKPVLEIIPHFCFYVFALQGKATVFVLFAFEVFLLACLLFLRVVCRQHSSSNNKRM